MPVDAVELIGYTASGLLVVSLMMTSLVRLRVVNLVGSVTFGVYALLIGSVPVLLTNVAIAAINVHHLLRLWRERSRHSYFEVVAVPPSSPLLQRFVDHHAQDIARFQPEFRGVREDHRAWMVLRDALPAGVVVATMDGSGGALLDLDYVTEPHRDLRPGTVLFDESGAFEAAGITRVFSRPGTPAHQRYLKRMGFVRQGAAWWRELQPGADARDRRGA